MKQPSFILAFGLLFLTLGCVQELRARPESRAKLEVPATHRVSQGGTAQDALRAALKWGAQRSVEILSRTGGFNDHPVVRITLPDDAEKMRIALSRMGLEKQIEQFEEDMNRAAEQAVRTSGTILIDAVQKLTIEDAANIIASKDDRMGTRYLYRATHDSLIQQMAPLVREAMGGEKVMDSWQKLTATYNRLPFTKPIDTDLEQYVCQKTLHGLFYEIGEQEAKIRRDPKERATDLIKQFFGGN